MTAKTSEVKVTLERHPLSAVFGDMSTEEMVDLKDSIVQNGLLDSKIYLYEGKILDGWHRYTVAPEAGYENHLEMVEYRGDNPISFVMGRNVARRHLSASQRASIVLSACEWHSAGRPADDGEAMTAKEMAAAAGVSVKMIQRAKSVLESNPEKRQEMVDGTTTASKELNRAKVRGRFVKNLVETEVTNYANYGFGSEPREWWDRNEACERVEEAIATLQNYTETERDEMFQEVFSEYLKVAVKVEPTPPADLDNDDDIDDDDDSVDNAEKNVDVKSEFDDAPAVDTETEDKDSFQELADDEQQDDLPPEVETADSEDVKTEEEVPAEVIVDETNGCMKRPLDFDVETTHDAIHWLETAAELIDENPVFQHLAEHERFSEQVGDVYRALMALRDTVDIELNQ